MEGEAQVTEVLGGGVGEPELPGPGELFATPDSDTVYLFPPSEAYPAGIWVRFKRTISYGQDLQIQSALFKGMGVEDAVAAAGGTTSTIYTDIGRQKMYRQVSWVLDWNLPGPNGQTVPWPRDFPGRVAVIGDLNPKVGAWLEYQIAQRERALADARSGEGEQGKDPLPLPTGGRGRSSTRS